MITMATVAEVPAIITLAKQFETFSQHVTVDVEHCIQTYTRFIETGMGVIFLLKDDHGTIIGGLGAITAPDLHTGALMAIECFWCVNPEQRGQGITLFNAFESWAQEQQCHKIAMIHLEDSHPKQLEKIYARRGYALVERHYIKEVSP